MGLTLPVENPHWVGGLSAVVVSAPGPFAHLPARSRQLRRLTVVFFSRRRHLQPFLRKAQPSFFVERVDRAFGLLSAFIRLITESGCVV